MNIFDDDFILTKSFDHDFSKLIEIIGSSWDIIYLGASQWLWDGIKRSETNFYRPNQNTNGSFAVLYNRSSFRQLIEEIDSMKAPFDELEVGEYRITFIVEVYNQSTDLENASLVDGGETLTKNIDFPPKPYPPNSTK